MLTIGLFCAGLLVYALFSRLLDRASITAQILMLAIGVGLGVAVRGTSETIVDTELLRVAGELALILALVVDAARINIGALRKTAGIPIRLLVIGLPLTILAGTIVAMLLLPGITVIEAVIVATLLAPTDAALGAMVVNSPIVPRRIRQALNVESGLNDGLVTPIVLVAAAVAVAGGESGTRRGSPTRSRRSRSARSPGSSSGYSGRSRYASLSPASGCIPAPTGWRRRRSASWPGSSPTSSAATCSWLRSLLVSR